MSLKIENCRPVFVGYDQPRTLSEIKEDLPYAISLESVYYDGSEPGHYWHVVVMPYSFPMPDQSELVHGDRIGVVLSLPTETYSLTAGTKILSQFVKSIDIYYH